MDEYTILNDNSLSLSPHTAVAFGWMKFLPGNFLRTDLNTHLFVSYNGKLYFSEVGISDAAVYYCMVKLMPLRGSTIGTDQPPARVSLPIELEVTDSCEYIILRE